MVGDRRRAAGVESGGPPGGSVAERLRRRGRSRTAGHLLAAIGAGSELAVDALVVATAIRLGGGLVLTHDPVDLRRLAARHANVVVAAI